MGEVLTVRRDDRFGLHRWERGAVAVLSLTLIALALPRLGAALWSATHTWLARGETHVELPTRYEVPAGSASSSAAELGLTIFSGGFGTGEFVLSSVDATAHLQLTLARVIVAISLLALLALVATVGARVALGRSVVPMVARGSAVCGLLLLTGSLAAGGFEAAALRAIAADLREVAGVGSVFPEDVRFTVEWLAVCGGLALLIVALVMRSRDCRGGEQVDTVPSP
ncbi:hypothetical protein GCM10011331_18920 [Flavimobilis marinus]|uniref:Uncharacterized protein n=1 Tax=Flavimobilis marinus TaxID=285351 RepID=A0A1I2F2A8_9MICO|nr:hypothetical protein [Flavimobilis marinus]GHG53390.1 hypothetical protein GCM10011331_18920 [Flavimobilis marinus]SFE98977.1 hypothetical protein SAMN04488035_1062 [Flavimobilis marinus]